MLPKRKQKRKKVYQKPGNKHGRRTGKKRIRQGGGFLNRYDFAYTGRDFVNQAGKIAPAIIKQATGKETKLHNQE